MKRLVLVGVLVGAFAVSGFAQTKAQEHGRRGTRRRRRSRRPSPATARPTAQMALGSVHIPKGVKADGKPLAAGTYQVRLTPQSATPDAKGQTAVARALGRVRARAARSRAARS